MFIAEGVQADAELREIQEVDSLIAALEDQGFRPVLRTMVSAACDVASISRDKIGIKHFTERRAMYRRREARTGLPGDLLIKDNLAFVLQPVGHRLHIWQIRYHATPSMLETFCSAVESSVRSRLDGRRVRGMNFSWRPIKERIRRYSPQGAFIRMEN